MTTVALKKRPGDAGNAAAFETAKRRRREGWADKASAAPRPELADATAAAAPSTADGKARGEDQAEVAVEVAGRRAVGSRDGPGAELLTDERARNEFRAIDGLDGKYEVNRLGEVRYVGRVRSKSRASVTPSTRGTCWRARRSRRIYSSRELLCLTPIRRRARW